ncbi:MAG: 4Fe-4S binding protein [Fibrobacter sp.]|nr:4Fe-4S binding protein [Fibrobacter sp.]
MKNSLKELVVVSGKGGTGKTSLTASLIHCFDNKVIADCDVDAADLHLVLNLHDTVSEEFSGGNEAIIDPKICNLCGLCAEKCRFDAISLVDNQYVVSDCEGCRVCVDICPEKAIAWEVAIHGKLKYSQSDEGDVFHARLDPGAENSGKLVAAVREKARKRAESLGAEWIFVDGPPGIGCPAIAALTGADAALLVTEPTPSGLHDLERVLDLCKHFRLPAYIVINKFDLNKEMTFKIREIGIRRGTPVLACLPYSSLFTDAQLQGKSLAQAFPESEEMVIIKNLAQKLTQKIKN